jgi:hypothetical protein
MINIFQKKTDLHEEAGDQGLSDVDIVVAAGEFGAGALQVETVHDSGQLGSNAVGALQRTVVYKVLVAPRRVLVVFIN